MAKPSEESRYLHLAGAFVAGGWFTGLGPEKANLAVPTVSLLPPDLLPLRVACPPCLPVLSSVLPKQAFRRSFRAAAIRPTTARHSLHLRFAKSIPKNFRGVFSDAAAGIAAVSFRLNFPNSLRGLLLREWGHSPRPMSERCACGPSRASTFCDSYPQLAANAVDNAG